MATETIEESRTTRGRAGIKHLWHAPTTRTPPPHAQQRWPHEAEAAEAEEEEELVLLQSPAQAEREVPAQ